MACTAFRSLQRLVLKDAHFETFGYFTRFFRTFRSLKHLELRDVICDAAGHYSCRPAHPKLPQLDTLVLIEHLRFSTIIPLLIPWLIAVKVAYTLSKLTGKFHSFDADRFYILSDLFTAASSLKVLEVELPIRLQMSKVHPGPLTSLDTLVLHGSGILAIQRLIEQLSPPKLSRINITWNAYSGIPFEKEWDALDQIATLISRLRSLTSFTLKISFHSSFHRSDHRDPSEWAQSRLMEAERGVASVYEQLRARFVVQVWLPHSSSFRRTSDYSHIELNIIATFVKPT